MTWHIGAEDLDRYVAGRSGGATAASVEAHLLGCDQCRSMVAPSVDRTRLDSVWLEVVEQVDAPRRLWSEPVLTSLGLRADEARLVSAAPALRASWLLSLAAVLGFVAAASGADSRGTWLFLVVAPLIPLLSVLAAFGPGIDPTHDIARSTPYPLPRLQLLRSLAVLGAAIPVTAGWSLVTQSGWLSFAWLAPGLAMATVTLAASPRFGVLPAAGVVSACYLGVIGAWGLKGELAELYAAPAQLVCAALVAVSAAVLLQSERMKSYRRLA